MPKEKEQTVKERLAEKDRESEYGATLNLPKTDFPMRANLPQREPEIQKFWKEHEIYQKVQEQAKAMGLPKFILHDGPPYANGHIHIGHALNKTLKDMVTKFWAFKGHFAPYVHGWDTHGLPIEQQVIKDLGLNRHAVSPVEFRRKCRDYALKFAAIQMEEFKRLGVWGNWEDSYYTLLPEYEARQITVFGEMARKGYIYKGLKPVYWCVSCETALAEAEIEYADHTSGSLYVKFPVKDDQGKLGMDAAGLSRTSFVIWTTTAWTLPANLAIAVHPDFEYAVVQVDAEYFVVAKELVERLAHELAWPDHRVVQTIPGRELERIRCQHPFIDRESVVILGEHVTLDQGTGCVHTAPGHGQEDFDVGMKYGLQILSPVTNRGHFTEEAGKYAGMTLEDGGKAIVKDLAESGHLLKSSSIRHSYPHCWRCKHPVIFRATEQWFASVDGFRDAALQAVRQVKWYPAWGEERISNMIAERHDWCISRQRVWGVPIPIFYCEKCGEHLINDETIAAVSELFGRKGSDAWFELDAGEILPRGIKCPNCGNDTFRKETDIMDVWFDSGSSHAAVLEEWDELAWPADLYLEGSDQHRGWFQSSLLTAVATRGRAPYKAVLTHGYTVDAEGHKMSKSVGNVVAPEKVIKEFGADVLRLWVTSADYTDDVRISDGILKQMSEVYRRIRNTFRFILGNLYDFDPVADSVPYEELFEIDKWALMRLMKLVERVTRGFEDYQFHVFYHAVHNFCAVDLSAFYLDVLKDRLYASGAKSKERRAAQTALYEILHVLVRMIAPVLVHTAEEIWQYLPAKDRDGAKKESVQMAFWPQVKPEHLDEALEARWERLLDLRDEVAKALELARSEKLIGNSLEAEVELYLAGETPKEMLDLIERYRQDLAMIFIVSGVKAHTPGKAPDKAAGPDKAAAGEPDKVWRSETIPGLGVLVKRAPGVKCERCWNYSTEAGRDAAHPNLCPRCTEVVKAG
ncbi:MAG: isoleucine--tRNA ligase [Syntrophothermus sp.]